MYQVNVELTGTAAIMQHKFSLEKEVKGAGQQDYSEEWKKTIYTKGGEIVQPSTHIIAALVKAASTFKIQGKRGKTFKDIFNAYLFVEPEYIPHGIPIPDELDDDPDKQMYVDRRPVVVQRSRVVRARACIHEGWKLAFKITVIDDDLPVQVLNDALIMAGRIIGIGEYRPRFGRFMVSKFEVVA